MIFSNHRGRKISKNEILYLEILDGLLHIGGLPFIVLEPKLLFGLDGNKILFIDPMTDRIEKIIALNVSVQLL